MQYVGIDVGKRESAWFAADDSGRRVGKGRMASSKRELQALIDRLLALEEGVEVAIEAGNLTFELARAMQQRGADVFVIHPLDNALIARSRRKTDGIDAKMLSEQRRLHILPPHAVHVPSEACEDLRHLVTVREALVDQRTAVTNQTLHVLARYGIFSAKRVFKADSGWEKLATHLDGLRSADKCTVQHRIAHGLFLNRQVREFEAVIAQQLAHHFSNEQQLLRTIPGIGLITAAAVIAWGHPVTRFGTARQFTSYAGLAPSTRQSGDKKVDGGTAHTGNRHLARNLVQAALSFSRTTNDGHELWRWYEKVRRKRGWRKARVALARKLAAASYGVLKHGAPYDAKHIASILDKEVKSS